MLTRFAADGFRNLRGLDIELGRVNVLIGANNCGKTNLFEAMESVRQFVAPGAPNGVDLGAALAELGGAHLADSAGSGSVKLAWTFDSCSYELNFSLPTDAARWPQWRVDRESLVSGDLSYFARTDLRTDTAAPGDGAVVIGGNAVSLPAMIHYQYTAGSSTGWRFPPGQSKHPGLETAFALLAADAEGLAAASFPRHLGARDQGGQPRVGSDRLSPRGDNLAHVLREYEQKPPFLDPVLLRLRHLVPGLTRVGSADAQGTVWVNLTVDGALRPLRGFSDGTVQALRLAALLFRSRHQTLLLDEPELSLHPAWQREVARWLLDSDKQSVVATHSPELLDALTPAFRDGSARLFVMADGAVKRVDPAEFQADLDEGWEFGDLYRRGFPTLGGWPE